MIDLHLHILPGVDDGSRDMDDSLAMADLAARSGVRTLVVTPHSNQMGRFENFCSSELTEAFDELETEVKRAGIPIRILRGMEIYASEDIGRKIRQGMLTGLAGSHYYLVEVPFGANLCLFLNRKCGIEHAAIFEELLVHILHLDDKLAAILILAVDIKDSTATIAIHAKMFSREVLHLLDVLVSHE